MITALCWVQKGAAAQQPRKFDLTEEEFDKLNVAAGIEIQDAKLQLEQALAAQLDSDAEDYEGEQEDDEEDAHMNGDDGDQEMEDMDVDGQQQHQEGNDSNDDELAEYNMDDYDNEPAGGTESVNIFANVRSLAYYKDQKDDPYLELVDDAEEEGKDLEIMPTDMLLCLAKTSEQISGLEVHVFEPAEENLYTHHDYMLPTLPLALEWMDFTPGDHSDKQRGNLLAVGGFTPQIEVWDLDVVDALYPAFVLGSNSSSSSDAQAPEQDQQQKNKKKKKKKAQQALGKQTNDTTHVDAVLGLSWNRDHRQFLASCSADTTVKIWDLQTQKVVRSYVPHAGAKVALVHWSPAAPTVLLTAGHNATVAVFDSRSPEQQLTVTLPTDAESAQWAPVGVAESQFAVSTDDGHVYWYDARNLSSSVWTLHAHDASCSSLSLRVQPVISKTASAKNTKGLTMATGGDDGTVKVWDLSSNKPSMAQVRKADVGKIFCVDWCPDEDNLLAVGGSKGSLVWSLRNNELIRSNDGDISGDEDSDAE
ncbi:rRNA-processing protein [Sorochytrium milnesiophthora]